MIISVIRSTKVYKSVVISGADHMCEEHAIITVTSKENDASGANPLR